MLSVKVEQFPLHSFNILLAINQLLWCSLAYSTSGQLKSQGRRSVGRFHMICDSWLFLCLCQQSNSFYALFRIAALAQWQPVECHCPKWLTHCSLFSVKIPRLLSERESVTNTTICHGNVPEVSWRSEVQPSLMCFRRMIKRTVYKLQGVCMVFLCVLPSFIWSQLHQQTQPDSLVSLFGVSPQTQR